MSRVAIVTCSLSLSRTPTIFPLSLLPHASFFHSPRSPLFTRSRNPQPSQAVTYIISLPWHNHLNVSCYLSQSVKESVAKELAGSTPFFFLHSFPFLIVIALLRSLANYRPRSPQIFLHRRPPLDLPHPLLPRNGSSSRMMHTIL